MSEQKGFEDVRRVRKLKENETVIGLRESEKLIGQLYPVLVDEEGNILDGQHRVKANPDWRREVVKGIDSERKRAMVRLHANWHRRFVKKDEVLAEIGEITSWIGAAPYAAFLGCNLRTIQRHLPQKYKQRKRVPKRQLSLSVEENISRHEIERRSKLQQKDEENKLRAEKIREEQRLRIEIQKQQIARGETYLRTDTGLWKCKSQDISVAAGMDRQVIPVKEIRKENLIWKYLYDLPDEEILAYVAKVNSKARSRVEKVANRILELRRRTRERENRERIFEEKVEELYARFRQVTVEFTDGSTIPLNLKYVKLDDFFFRHYKKGGRKWIESSLKENILPALAKEMLGFDERGYLLTNEKSDLS